LSITEAKELVAGIQATTVTEQADAGLEAASVCED